MKLKLRSAAAWDNTNWCVGQLASHAAMLASNDFAVPYSYNKVNLVYGIANMLATIVCVERKCS